MEELAERSDAGRQLTPWDFAGPDGLELLGPRARAEDSQQLRDGDKAHIASMAPVWAAQRKARAEQAFQEWKADRAKRLRESFAKANGEDQQGFPPPSHHIR